MAESEKAESKQNKRGTHPNSLANLNAHNGSNGRPKLSEEQKRMKYEALNKAVEIMHKKINDIDYIEGLKPGELQDMLELVFDRCGLPKVQKNEITGEDGGPVKTEATNYTKMITERARKLLEDGTHTGNGTSV
jgi:hypothetical protein